MSVLNKLWGFRSNCLWKKILATAYYLFVLVLIFTSAFEVPDIKANIYDLFIFKLSNILMSFSFLIPILLMSNFSLKNKIPILKNNKWWSDLVGSLLVFLIVVCSSEIINIFHTSEYLQRLDAYNTTEIIYKEHDPDYIPEEEKSDLTQDELNNNFEDLTKEENNDVQNEQPKEETPKKEDNKGNNTSQENNNSQEQEEVIEPEPPVVATKIMKAHYIDVGQGDSIFVELPNGQTLLIDAGESSKGATVTNYISKLGYVKIDYLIGTHPHSDHIGGLAYVINNFSIGNIYMPKAVSTSKTYENLLNTIAAKGLSVTTAKAGVNIINNGNLKIDIIAPNSSSYSNLNNYSAVIKITHGTKKFLFMGDAETKSENEILSDVSVDVIKIGHHGSDTSSGQSFVNKVKPQIAIVMVGNNNRYDHPYQEIINRWINVGATIYRTDLNGTIVVSSDGTNLNISTSR